MAPKREQQSPTIFTKPSPKPKKHTLSAPPKEEMQEQQIKAEHSVASAHALPQGPMEQQEMASATESKLGDFTASSTVENQSSLKRPAESELANGPPAKQRRTQRKYSARPTWAKLSKHNPRFQHQQAQNGMPSGAREQQDQPNGGQVQQLNGQPNVNGAILDGQDPWLRNPPLDDDLIHAQQVLGKWEKTFQWNTPIPDILNVVQGWLYTELNKLGDVGTNPEEGTIEIEAKIGTIMQEGSLDRLRLPVQSMAVVSEDYRRHHFESQMTMVSVHEFKQVNKLQR